MKSKDNLLVIDGVVESVCGGVSCSIRLDNDVIMKGVLSGNMRRNSIRVSVGDKVKVEISPNSLELGRVVYRY